MVTGIMGLSVLHPVSFHHQKHSFDCHEYVYIGKYPVSMNMPAQVYWVIHKNAQWTP